MWRYEVRARDSVLPAAPCRHRIAFLRADEFDLVRGSNPYLEESDLERFEQLDSVCIVVLDGPRVAASAFMSSGRIAVSELDRVLVVPPAEHYCSRAFVDPNYRGQALYSHMLHAYAGQVPGDHVLWGLLYEWNVASARSCEAVGWKRTTQYWTRFLLRRQSCGERSVDPAAQPSA